MKIDAIKKYVINGRKWYFKKNEKKNENCMESQSFIGRPWTPIKYQYICQPMHWHNNSKHRFKWAYCFSSDCCGEHANFCSFLTFAVILKSFFISYSISHCIESFRTIHKSFTSLDSIIYAKNKATTYTPQNCIIHFCCCFVWKRLLYDAHNNIK